MLERERVRLTLAGACFPKRADVRRARTHSAFVEDDPLQWKRRPGERETERVTTPCPHMTSGVASLTFKRRFSVRPPPDSSLWKSGESLAFPLRQAIRPKRLEMESR